MSVFEEPDRAPEPLSEPMRSSAMRISNAVGHVHKRMVGRGPTNVRTLINDTVVLCLLEGGFTQAEHTVLEHVGNDPVEGMRIGLQAAMRHQIIDAVETVLGRRVRSFMSANDPEHDIQAEIILLDPPAGAPRHGDDRGGVDDVPRARAQ